MSVWIGVGVLTGIVLTGIALLGVLRWRRRLVVVSVESDSMRPVYAPGERVLVRRVDLHRVKTGQVVVFASPPAAGGTERTSTRSLDGTEWLIKRVGAVPGDPMPDAVRPHFGTDTRVPSGHLVVLGDNPDRSMDSRHWGPVPASYLLGIVLRRLP